MINREEAIVLLKKYLRDEDNIKYSLAVEAVIREIAKKLDRNEDLWGLTGLLHNIDYEYTINEPEKRGTLSAQLLEGLLPDRAVNAIIANNYMHTDYIPITSLDKTLIAVDTAIGLVIATVRSMPSKKIADVDLITIINKFNDPSFFTGYSRNKIQLCEDVGIELKLFFKLLLDTLNKMSDELNI
jgi:predicted hydrolase (HD superfamily)